MATTISVAPQLLELMVSRTIDAAPADDGICYGRNPWAGCGLRVRCAHLTRLRGWHCDALCPGVCRSGTVTGGSPG